MCEDRVNGNTGVSMVAFKNKTETVGHMTHPTQSYTFGARALRARMRMRAHAHVTHDVTMSHNMCQTSLLVTRPPLPCALRWT